MAQIRAVEGVTSGLKLEGEPVETLIRARVTVMIRVMSQSILATQHITDKVMCQWVEVGTGQG